MKVLVTGAGGFIGKAVFSKFKELPDVQPVGASRAKSEEYSKCPELSQFADWSGLLREVDVIVHAAARAHVLNETSPNPVGMFREANVAGTLALARQAVQAGVKRFIFLSSIGVNGNFSTIPFTEKDTPAPWGDYAQSKYEAEQQLLSLAEETGLEVVIIRPPLVYGPNAPGNFGLLEKVVAKGLPLPLAGIRNQRSFVSIWNLVDLITLCLDHPEAVGEVFVVCDGEDVSTTELLEKIGSASGCPVRLFWMPSLFLKFGASLMRKREAYDRLFGSLQVDASHVKKTLGWTPPFSLDEGLKRCFLTRSSDR